MEKLRRLRTERGLSQARLAARAELDPSTVNQIERGAREASPATLRKLAKALDVSVAEVLEDVSPKVSGRSSHELRLFNGGEAERRFSLEIVESCIQYAIGRAEYYEQELERGRATDYGAADSAFTLASVAIDEFSSFNGWLHDGPARKLRIQIENGAAPELEDEFDALIDTLVERISRTQRALLNYAARLDDGERVADLDAKRREMAASAAKVERDIA